MMHPNDIRKLVEDNVVTNQVKELLLRLKEGIGSIVFAGQAANHGIQPEQFVNWLLQDAELSAFRAEPGVMPPAFEGHISYSGKDYHVVIESGRNSLNNIAPALRVTLR